MKTISPIFANFTNLSYTPLNSNITLLNGYVLIYTIKQNKLIYEARMLDVEKVKNDILLYILDGYMQILMDYEAVSMAQAQIDATSMQVERTKIFVKFGSWFS